MYQALYRKYRPRTFSDVTGQDHITTTLRNQLISGRLSHAYLFVGTRGTGKTTCAKILARAVNCLNPVNGDPCNKCPNCVGIENGSILDVLEMDAASNTGVDDVRALREDAIYTPAVANRRVYIIDEVHMLSNSAFNALLKILEEPPSHLIFILATTALHKVPATILSRCQRFLFKRISPAAIIDRLNYVAKSEGITLSQDAAKELASLADGSMRDALSLFDQCASDTVLDLQRVLDTIGLVGRQETLALVRSAAAGNIIGALDILDRVYNNGRDMSSLLSEMASLIRDVLVFKLSPDSPLLSGGFSHGDLSALSAALSPERLFSLLRAVRESGLSLSQGAGIRITMEMCLIRMCDERLSDDTSALLSRIESLESGATRATGAARPNVECKMQNVESKDKEPEIDLSPVGADTIRPLSKDVELAPPPVGAIVPDRPPDGDVDITALPVGADTIPGLVKDSQVCHSERSEESLPFATQRITDPSVALLPQDDTISQDSTIRPLDAEVTGSTHLSDPWQQILEHIKHDMSIYMPLSDSRNAQAELQDNVLIVRTGNIFLNDSFERLFKDSIALAAKDVLKREIIVRFEPGVMDITESSNLKIDDLSKFGIVEFE